MGAFVDITGQTFGRLTVLGRAPNRGTITMWKCVCSCPEHNEVVVSGYDLKAGKVRSCGCLKKELIRDRCGAKLQGKIFGRLEVLECVGKDGFNNLLWKCRCLNDGNIIIATSAHLLSGHTQSCGCYKADRSSETHTKYKDDVTKHLAITVLGSMKDRCYNENCKDFPGWGGRGITICKEWMNDPEEFAKWAVGNGYSPGLSIDRIDNSGPYSPENCRWVTMCMQANNKRNNRYISIDGYRQTIAQWCRDIGINPDRLYSKSDFEVENIIRSYYMSNDSLVFPSPPSAVI